MRSLHSLLLVKKITSNFNISNPSKLNKCLPMSIQSIKLKLTNEISMISQWLLTFRNNNQKLPSIHLSYRGKSIISITKPIAQSATTSWTINQIQTKSSTPTHTTNKSIVWSLWKLAITNSVRTASLRMCNTMWTPMDIVDPFRFCAPNTHADVSYKRVSLRHFWMKNSTQSIKVMRTTGKYFWMVQGSSVHGPTVRMLSI